MNCSCDTRKQSCVDRFAPLVNAPLCADLEMATHRRRNGSLSRIRRPDEEPADRFLADPARYDGIMLVGAGVTDFGATAIRKFTDARKRKFTPVST